MPTYITKPPVAHSATYVKATSTYSTAYPHLTTDPATSLTGESITNQWVSSAASGTQKFNIDHGSGFIMARLYIENSHNYGTLVTRGIKDILVYGTNSPTAFANTVYADTTDLTLLATLTIDAHVSADTADPKYYLITGNTTSYRYTVIRIISGYGAQYIGIRRLEVQYDDSTPPPSSSAFPSSSASSGGQPVILPTVRQLIDLPYSLMASVRTLVNLLYSSKLSTIVTIRYGDLTELRKITYLRYGDLAIIRRIIDILYGDLSSYRNLVNIDYNLMSQVRGLVNIPYHMIQGELRKLINMPYDLRLLDSHKNLINIIYSIASGEPLEEITTLSIINENGYELNPFHLNIEKDEGDPCIRVEIRSNDENDFVKNPVKTRVSVTVNSDTYIVLVEASDISTQISDDGTQLVDVYSFKLSSPCFLLDDPYASVLTEELTGMASEIATYVAGTVSDFDSYGVSWALLDWYIGQGVFQANDMTPISILEKLANACGGILQSKKDGTLELRPEYPTNIPDYDTETPTVFLTDQENFYSVSSTTDRYNDYNNFLIGNVEPDVSGLEVRSENVTSTLRDVFVYQVPFVFDDNVQLKTSGGSHVDIRSYGVIDLLISSEEVEIVDGEGQTAFPIYSLNFSEETPIHKIENYKYSETDLGVITAKEDKTISTAIKENSIVVVTYYTRYRRFTVEDEKVENVQFWPEII